MQILELIGCTSDQVAVYTWPYTKPVECRILLSLIISGGASFCNKPVHSRARWSRDEACSDSLLTYIKILMFFQPGHQPGHGVSSWGLFLGWPRRIAAYAFPLWTYWVINHKIIRFFRETLNLHKIAKKLNNAMRYFVIFFMLTDKNCHVSTP